MAQIGMWSTNRSRPFTRGPLEDKSSRIFESLFEWINFLDVFSIETDGDGDDQRVHVVCTLHGIDYF